MTQVAKVLLVDPDGFGLLLLRSDHPTFPNDPDLPGGTVEVGEAVDVAAIREVLEETGIDIADVSLTHLYTGSEYSHHDTTYTLYSATLPNRPEVVISWEHASYEWVPLDEFVSRAGAATDTYMQMVHDTLAKTKN